MHADAVSDTSPDAARVQLGLLRRASVEQRLQGCLRWSRTMIALSRSGTRARHPEATEDEMLVAWVADQYGRDLARRVAQRIGVRWPTNGPSSS